MNQINNAEDVRCNQIDETQFGATTDKNTLTNTIKSKGFDMTHLENFKKNAPHSITFIPDINGETYQVELHNLLGMPVGITELAEMIYHIPKAYILNDDELDKLVALEIDESEGAKVTLFHSAERLLDYPSGNREYRNYLDTLNTMKDVLKQKITTQ